MASTLKERQVGIAFIVYRLPGKSPNLRRQPVRIVRDLDALFRHQPASAVVVHHMLRMGVERHGEQHRLLGFQLLPFETLPLAVDVEALRVAPGHMVEKAGHFDAHIAVLQGDKGGLKSEGAAIGLFHLFAHLAGTLAVHALWALSQQHQAGGHRVGGVHQGREAQPVVWPSLHVLVMGAAHELDPAQLPFFVQVLHIQEFPPIDGGFHEHIVLSALFPGLDDLVQLVDGHAHGNGASAVLACVQCLYRQGSVRGRGCHQMDRVNGLVRQHGVEVRQALLQQELVADLVQLRPVGIHQYQGIHIWVFQVDGHKLRAERDPHQRHSELAVFHFVSLLGCFGSIIPRPWGKVYGGNKRYME